MMKGTSVFWWERRIFEERRAERASNLDNAGGDRAAVHLVQCVGLPLQHHGEDRGLSVSLPVLHHHLQLFGEFKSNSEVARLFLNKFQNYEAHFSLLNSALHLFNSIIYILLAQFLSLKSLAISECRTKQCLYKFWKKPPSKLIVMKLDFKSRIEFQFFHFNISILVSNSSKSQSLSSMIVEL